MNTLNTDPQQDFFQQILDRFPKNAAAISAMSDLLNVREDGIYRRIKGKTSISLQEAMQLAKAYGVSIDALRPTSSEAIQWSFSAFQRPVRTFDDFIDDILQQIQMVHKMDEVEITYTTKDLPVFHAMQFPEILAFKLYTWGVTTWQMEDLQDRAFRFDMISEALLEKAREISSIYYSFRSHELWSDNVLKNILRQIEYLATIELFVHEADAFLLCDRLSEFVKHMQNIAELGEKKTVDSTHRGGSFELYHNEMVHTNNIILAETPQTAFVLTVFCNPYSMQCRDAKTVQFVKTWMKNLIRHSNSISVHSPLERRQFFGRLEKDVQRTRQRLNRIFDNR